MSALDFRTLHSVPIFIPLYDTRDVHYINQTGILPYNLGIYLCVFYTVSRFVVVNWITFNVNYFHLWPLS